MGKPLEIWYRILHILKNSGAIVVDYVLAESPMKT